MIRSSTIQRDGIRFPIEVEFAAPTELRPEIIITSAWFANSGQLVELTSQEQERIELKIEWEWNEKEKE